MRVVTGSVIVKLKYFYLASNSFDNHTSEELCQHHNYVMLAKGTEDGRVVVMLFVYYL